MDMSGLPPAVRERVIKNLAHEDAAQHALGQIEQVKMKRLMDQIVQPGCFNECGRQVFMISPDQHQRLMHKYGKLCFMDDDFVKWLLKRPVGEDMKVKDVGTRIQSGYTGRGFAKAA
jgi:hypothetical protein